MNFNFSNITVGYTKNNTLDNAFNQAQKVVEQATGVSFSQEESLKAREGLTPIFGGLDNCLNSFAKKLLETQKVAA